MKGMILILSLMSIQMAFAGNGSGTMGQERNSEEIVLNQGESGEVIRIQHGVLIEGKWEITPIEIKKVDLTNDPNVREALEKSKDSKQWEKIRN